MNTNGQRQAPYSDESTRYVLDRLIQDLTTKLLPFLLTGSRFHVEIDHGGKPGEPAKLKITEIIN